MKTNMNVSVSLPQTEFALLKKMAKAMGWNLFVEQEKDSVNFANRNKVVEKLYGCFQLPDDFDYKAEKEKYLSEKYLL